jgi:hypothetical protein
MADVTNPSNEVAGDVIPVLAPVMDMLTQLAESALVLTEPTMPGAHSLAVDEQAAAMRIAGADFHESVHAAHSNASILRFAATDQVRQFAKMFRSPPVPVYAHLSVARSALESSALSYWLSIRNLDVTARVQRYEAVRLNNGLQLERSKIPKLKQHGKPLIAKVRAEGATRGWKVIANNSRVVVGDQQLPSIGSLISDLLAGDDDKLRSLGENMWWFLCGASHATNYALMQSVQIANPSASPLEPTRVSIFTSSRSVILQSLVIGRAFRSLIEEHAALFGWQHTEWTCASRDFVGFARRTLEQLGPEPRVA